MGRVLVASLRVRDPQRRGYYLDFPKGTSEEEIVAKGVTVTFDKAWTEETPTELAAQAELVDDAQPETSEELPPPRAGKGSGRDEWAAFAAKHDVGVDEDMSRDDIADACEAAGLLE